MSYLLDTNVLSELTKPTPEQAVVDWFVAQRRKELWVSVITLGEIERGILLLDEGRKKQNLLNWLKSIRVQFAEQTLAIDDDVMKDWAALYSKPAHKGTMKDALDSLLAATSSHHSLTIATRNKSDFPDEITTFNPWKV